MKRTFSLIMLAVLAVGMSGCCNMCERWCNRPRLMQPRYQAQSCAPACQPCDPCQSPPCTTGVAGDVIVGP